MPPPSTMAITVPPPPPSTMAIASPPHNTAPQHPATLPAPHSTSQRRSPRNLTRTRHSTPPPPPSTMAIASPPHPTSPPPPPSTQNRYHLTSPPLSNVSPAPSVCVFNTGKQSSVLDTSFERVRRVVGAFDVDNCFVRNNYACCEQIGV